MVTSYIDTSAAMKLVVDEKESYALDAWIIKQPELHMVAAWLLHTELHCAAGRRRNEIPVEFVQTALESVVLFDLTRPDFAMAGTLAPLRAQDAIHLAVALRLGADEIITYDDELITAAKSFGLRTVSPGR